MRNHLTKSLTPKVGGFLVIGTASMIASIPFVIVSGSYNRKAKAMLGSGKVEIGAIPFNNLRYVSIGLNIDF